jgi:hypothetical protein
MSAERIAIVGSSTYPTPDDVATRVLALPPGTVVVTDDRAFPGHVVRTATARRGIDLVFHEPNRARDGDAASYRQAEAIVAGCDRLVAFAAMDPKTKAITEGTALRIRLAERRGIPVEVIETPVPARVCDLITRLRHRYDGIRHAPTPGHQAYRIRSAYELVGDLVRVRTKFETRMLDGWKEIDETADAAERDAKENAWCAVLLATYRIVSDVVDEAMAVLGPLSAPGYPLHRQSLHRVETREVPLCP